MELGGTSCLATTKPPLQVTFPPSYTVAAVHCGRLKWAFVKTIHAPPPSRMSVYLSHTLYTHFVERRNNNCCMTKLLTKKVHVRRLVNPSPLLLPKGSFPSPCFPFHPRPHFIMSPENHFSKEWEKGTPFPRERGGERGKAKSFPPSTHKKPSMEVVRTAVVQFQQQQRRKKKWSAEEKKKGNGKEAK